MRSIRQPEATGYRLTGSSAAAWIGAQQRKVRTQQYWCGSRPLVKTRHLLSLIAYLSIVNGCGVTLRLSETLQLKSDWSRILKMKARAWRKAGCRTSARQNESHLHTN